MASQKVCVVVVTPDGDMAMPLNLKGGRVNEASAVSAAKGAFTLFTDQFSALKLARCEDKPTSTA